jgi:hypothetical protein
VECGESYKGVNALLARNPCTMLRRAARGLTMADEKSYRAAAIAALKYAWLLIGK